MARRKATAPKAKESRIEFVRRYKAEHPKLSVASARSKANAIYRIEGGPKSYPKLTHSLKEQGMTQYQARKYSQEFKEINREKYRRLAHPPKVRDIVTGEMLPMPKEQIKTEWLDDFRDLMEGLQSEFDIDFREAYKSGKAE